MQNLNTIKVKNYNVEWQRQSACRGEKVSVYFDNLENHLEYHIMQSRICLGCVAWLTNTKILKALSLLDKVSVIVNKEDFLRPDGYSTQKIREFYENLPSFTYDEVSQHYNDGGIFFFPGDDVYMGLLDGVESPGIESLRKGESVSPKIALAMKEWEWAHLPDVVNYARLSFGSTPFRSLFGGGDGLDSIRCLGVCNSSKSISTPRMHHKFLLFCDESAIPYAVWTGSFNFTQNGTQSIENAVVISDPRVVSAYWQEWAYVCSISESLDWESQWCAPDYYAEYRS